MQLPKLTCPVETGHLLLPGASDLTASGTEGLSSASGEWSTCPALMRLVPQASTLRSAFCRTCLEAGRNEMPSGSGCDSLADDLDRVVTGGVVGNAVVVEGRRNEFSRARRPTWIDPNSRPSSTATAPKA